MLPGLGYRRYPSINQMFNYGTTPILHGQHKHGTLMHSTQTPGTYAHHENIPILKIFNWNTHKFSNNYKTVFAQLKWNLFLGNMIMYPSINHRMGNYGSNPISYGPPKPSYGGAGKIPGYDLRVCNFVW